MRVQSKEALGDSVWTAKINGVLLEPSDDVSDPYPTPYTNGAGEPGQYRAWIVPKEVLMQGNNAIKIKYVQGKEASFDVIYMDLAVQ